MAGINIGTLVGYLTLQSNVAPALAAASQQMAATSKQLRDLGEQVQKAGSALTPISLAFAAAGSAAFKFGKDFETSMTRVMTVGGATRETMEKLREEVMNLAPKTGVGPSALAEGLIKIPLSAISAAEAIDILNTSARASALGMGSVADNGKLMTAIMKAYGEENMSAAKAADIMYATVIQGNADIDELSGSLGRVVGIASQVNVSFEEVGAFVATLSRLGLDADEAVTALRGSLMTLMQPSHEAKLALAGVGTSIEEVRASVKENGFAQTMIDLTKVFKGNVDAMGAVFGNVRALAGIMGTAAAQGDDYIKVLDAVKHSNGEMAKAFEELTHTVDFKWNQALARLEKTTIKVFDIFREQFASLVGLADPILTTIDFVLDAINKLPEGMQTAIFGISGAIALIGPVLLGVGVGIKAVGFGFEGLKVGFDMLAKVAPPVAGFITSIGTALSGVVGFITDFGAAAATWGLAEWAGGLLLFASAAAAVVTTGFAAWNVGKWIADIHAFGEEQMSVAESFEFGFVKIMNWWDGVRTGDADIEAAILSHRNLKTAIEEVGDALEFVGPIQETAADVWNRTVIQQANAEEMLVRFKQELDDLSSKVSALSEVQREAIRTGLDMAKTNQEIAAGLGIGESTVKAYAARLEEADKATKKFMDGISKSREEVEKLTAEFEAQQAALSGTSLDDRVAAIEAAFKTEVASLTETGEAYKNHYAALKRLADARKADVLSDFATMKDMSREFLEQQAQIARNTYDQMISSGLTFSHDVLEAQKQKIRDAEEAVKNYGGSWVAAMEKAGKATTEQTEKIVSLNDRASKSFDELMNRNSAGGSTSLNKGNIESFFEHWGVPKDFGLAAAEAGMSAQEITQAYKAFKNGIIDSVSDWVPSGPRIPGFSKGGMATMRVGEAGPETVRLPLGSTVFPNGVTPGGNTNSAAFNLTFNVGGAGEADQARKIYGHLMTLLKSSRQFGSV